VQGEAEGHAAVRVAVDIGGTFTDLFGLDERGHLYLAKTPTSPDCATGVLAGLDQAAVPPASVSQLIHGSTVAINAWPPWDGTAPRRCHHPPAQAALSASIRNSSNPRVPNRILSSAGIYPALRPARGGM
jgi:hypothetical protein